MILLIMLSLTLMWFFLDIAKKFFSYTLETDTNFVKTYDENNKSKFFILSFLFSFIRSALIVFVYVLIYPFLDNGFFMNAIIFYFIILSIKIIPDFMFLFQKFNIFNRFFVLEIISSLFEYAVVSFVLSFLMT